MKPGDVRLFDTGVVVAISVWAPKKQGRTLHIRITGCRNSPEVVSKHYAKWSNLTSTQVLNIARTAAATTGKRNAVLVTEAVSRAWAGFQVLTSA